MTNRATASRCKRVSVCVSHAYGKLPHEKNPAHLPRRGEKVTTFKTWGTFTLSSGKVLKLWHFKVIKWQSIDAIM
jgi:hypothetical protein